MKIALIEDDIILSEIIHEFLIEKNYKVEVFYDGNKALEVVLNKNFDLLLLDVNIPNINGFELLKTIRELKDKTPTIFITSLNSSKDLKYGFEIGADDYIKKPFDLEELEARIEHIKKIYHKEQNLIKISTNISLNLKNLTIKIDDKEINIANKEAQILNYLFQNRDRVISIEELIQNIWKFESHPNNSTIRTYIKNLRAILGKEYISNIKGVGYRFKDM